MIPYIIIFALALVVMWLQSNGYEKKIGNHSLWGIIYFCILFIFYAIRYNVGFDYPTYYKFIETEYYRLYIYDRWEYLSYFLMDIAHTFGNPQIFFVGIAGIALPLYYTAFQRYSRTPQEVMVSVLAFFALPIGFLYSLSLSRQFVALGILLYATKYMLRREFFKYVICAVVASCFHTYAISGIFFYWIASPNVKIKQCLYISGIIVAILYMGGDIISMLFPMFSHYLYETPKTNTGGLSQMVLYSLLGIILMVFHPDECEKKEEYLLWLKCYWIGIVICVALFPKAPSVGIRAGMIGLMYSFLCVPRVFMNISVYKWGKVVQIVAIGILFILYIYGLVITDPKTYIPYKVIW